MILAFVMPKFSTAGRGRPVLLAGRLEHVKVLVLPPHHVLYDQVDERQRADRIDAKSAPHLRLHIEEVDPELVDRPFTFWH